MLTFVITIERASDGEQKSKHYDAITLLRQKRSGAIVGLR